MESSNDTLVTAGQSITDAAGNVWTITAGGQVAVNGQVDPTTANVTHLAFVNGLVWQENTQDLWWSKSTPSGAWSPTYGTSVVPLAIPNVSVNDSVIGANTNAASANPSITDASGNIWAIANGQVTVNGAVDPTTANVIELAYVNGTIWQENSAGLWFGKTAPADRWTPTYGTLTNPVTGAFHILNDYGNLATVYVGELTSSPGFSPAPQSTAQIVTPGVQANGTTILVDTETATVVVDGNSQITNGGTLNLIGAYRTPYPVQGPLQNNGVMTLNASVLEAGALSGTGTIRATAGSTVALQSAGSGETIQLQSSYLTIGGQAFGAGGMSFLAPITMDSTSTITLNETPATSEQVQSLGGGMMDVYLFNGTTEVAAVTVRGVAHLYASESGSGTSAMTILSTTHPGSSLPILPYTG